MNYFQLSKSEHKMLSKSCQFSEKLMLYFCRNSHYSKHLVSCTSEWTRDSDLKIFNKNNKLVEAAGIEPALLSMKSLGCVSMLS